MRHQVTIKDIAKRLNISVATVSRALRDLPDIHPDTKKMVVDLAVYEANKKFSQNWYKTKELLITCMCTVQDYLFRMNTSYDVITAAAVQTRYRETNLNLHL